MYLRDKPSFSVAAALATTALAALLPVAAAAAPTSTSTTEIGPVVVTANRAPLPLDRTLAAVTVLDREDIERSQAPDLLSLLARQPGIDVARTGGPGQASTVFVRGANSGHALVLVDGVRINPATQGAPDFAHLPLGQIERIEIVRGPRAALWGSDAIGGVIQVFTRDPSKAFFEIHAGSYGRAGASAGAGFVRGDSHFGLALGHDRLRGFSATNSNYAFGNYPDQDGYRNRNAALRAGTSIGSQQLALSALLSNAQVEFDEGETAARNRVYALQLSGPLAAGWTQSLVLGHASEDLDTPVFLSNFGSAHTSLDWMLSKALDEHNAIDAGINLAHESGYSDEFYAGGFDRSRANSALFVSWRGRYARHSWEASLRHDRNSQFDSASTGSLAWGFQASEDWRLRASLGQGFRAPNFNELYYPGFEVAPGVHLFAGSPGLDPERSQSAEAGLDWTPSANSRLGLSLFRTRIGELVAFDGPLFEAINIDRAAIDGAELDFHARFGRLGLQGNASFLDARNADTGEALLRRARRKAALSADWRFDNGASLGIDLIAASARPDVGGVRLGGYSRVDLRATAPLAAGWIFEARVENLSDHDYQLVDGYNTPGRSGLLSLRWAGAPVHAE
ncbi:MAG: TonB-dependent receptor [Arenimonas sp.]